MSQCYEDIKAGGTLPSPSGAALRILNISSDPQASFTDVVEALEGDPVLAGQVLKFVNSPMAGTARKIGSLHQAVALLGMQTTVNLALGHSLISQKRQRACSKFDYPKFWSHSIIRATSARHLAGALGGVGPFEAFACGLLSHIGRLALANTHPAPYAQLLQRADLSNTRELARMERRQFGCSQFELTAEMMADWNLPDYFCQAVASQDSLVEETPDLISQTGQLAYLLHVGDLVCALLEREDLERDESDRLMAAVGRLPVQAFDQTFDAIAGEWRAIGTIFNVQTAAVQTWSQIHARAR